MRAGGGGGEVLGGLSTPVELRTESGEGYFPTRKWVAATKNRENELWPSKIRVDAKTTKHRKNVRTRGHWGSKWETRHGLEWKWPPTSKATSPRARE